MRTNRNERPTNGWLICDEGICLYADDYRIDKLKSDVPRCIKHGAILTPASRFLTGLTRKEARKALTV